MLPRTLLASTALSLAILAVSGCKDDKKDQPAPPAQPGTPAATQPAGAHADGHAGHEHVALGAGAAGAYQLKVNAEGAIQAGKEAGIEIDITGPEVPKAVRLWIGDEAGADARKVKADVEEEGPKEFHVHTHLDVPDPIPAGAKLWVEVETGAGKNKASFELKK